MVQLSHSYMTTGKTIALTIWIFVGKVMLMFFNMLSRFVIAFLPRSKHLLISWLQSPSAVILEPQKIVCHGFHCFPIYLPWSDVASCYDLHFWMLSLKLAFSFSSFIHMSGWEYTVAAKGLPSEGIPFLSALWNVNEKMPLEPCCSQSGCGPQASVSPGSWPETQNLSPSKVYQIRSCILMRSSNDSQAHCSLRCTTLHLISTEKRWVSLVLKLQRNSLFYLVEIHLWPTRVHPGFVSIETSEERSFGNLTCSYVKVSKILKMGCVSLFSGTECRA